ncbi:BZ3500_MvSof-1268-A1-R1_Chr5-3g08332 [Microbotryum saponariae]|uniref:proteasome endopeptidase complex n=1 Tax=Microbotryum saponariae TaxID=289078 RepID=A0A2X0KF51_9BASI|nr:BZ3500_MvSof-1268-A1-R1_Chr5-3g08332 [Microbotryum saponariae]SDA08440.1 BZ3501_MvSof-1269-A2-R1_Chr5-3g08060 [Microbotryum saponariae]
MAHSSMTTTLVPDVSHLKSGEVNLGTSIMACAFPGGVVIGADSRTTTGSYIANRVTDKLTYLHERIYCCRSGSAADTQAVADIVTAQLSQYAMQHEKRPTTAVAGAMLESICYSNKDSLSAGIIVAGWDKLTGGSVYNIPLGGGLFKGPWAIGGSGSAYIYGYCDATYREDWDKEQTVDFVRNALALAMARDGSSGGTIRMAIITEGGVERIFVPGDKLPGKFHSDGHVSREGRGRASDAFLARLARSK